MTEPQHALRLHAPADDGGAGELRLDELPAPTLDEHEVLVRVEASVLDPDDLAATAGAIRPRGLPRTLGRGGAGVVVAAGTASDDWAAGDPVAIDGGASCGRCVYCTTGRDNLCVAGRRLGLERDGTHARLVVVDGRHLVPAPGDVDPAQVAMLTRTVAVPYHALKRAGVGEDVTLAVHGCGGRGLHAVLLAQLAGAEVVAVDADAARRDTALAWGAIAAVDATGGDVGARVREVTEGGVDCSLELTGRSEQLRAAVESLRPGGRAALVGTGLGALPGAVLDRLTADELDVVGAGDPTLQDLGELLDLLADHRLDLSRSLPRRVATHELPDVLAELREVDGDPDLVVASPG